MDSPACLGRFSLLCCGAASLGVDARDKWEVPAPSRVAEHWAGAADQGCPRPGSAHSLESEKPSGTAGVPPSSILTAPLSHTDPPGHHNLTNRHRVTEGFPGRSVLSGSANPTHS